jgi:hypothetical protein
MSATAIVISVMFENAKNETGIRKENMKSENDYLSSWYSYMPGFTAFII